MLALTSPSLAKEKKKQKLRRTLRTNHMRPEFGIYIPPSPQNNRNQPREHAWSASTAASQLSHHWWFFKPLNALESRFLAPLPLPPPSRITAHATAYHETRLDMVGTRLLFWGYRGPWRNMVPNSMSYFHLYCRAEPPSMSVTYSGARGGATTGRQSTN